MKKLLLLMTLMAAIIGLSAQITGYTFSEGVGTYTPLATYAVSTAGGDDGTQLLTLPFSFTYNEIAYTTLGVCMNGFAMFGGTNSSWTNALESTSIRPIVAPLWDDHYFDASTQIRYQTLGTSPNRVFVVEWYGSLWYYNTPGTPQYFQLYLYETTNIVKFSYNLQAPAGTASASIGINALPGGVGNFLSVTPGSPSSVSSAVPNNSINSIANLPVGKWYQFNPPVILSPPNPATAFVPTNGALDVARNQILSWASGGGGPTKFYLSIGTDNPPTNLMYRQDMGLATSYTHSSLWNANQQYWWHVEPWNENGYAPGSSPITFTTGTNIIYPASGATSAADTDIGQVTLDSFANPATPGPITSNPLATGTYTNNTALGPIPVIQGNVYPFSMTQITSGTSFYGAYGKVYIDWNQNGAFDLVNELAFDGGVLTALATPTLSGNITVPMWASLGQTRMRVILRESGSAATTLPTGTFTWGETEDYTLLVTEPIVGVPAAPNLTYPANGLIGLPIGGFNLTWTPDLINGGVPDYYAVYMSQNEDDILNDLFFDNINATQFNPVTEGGVTFGYDETWYWTVEAVNGLGSAYVDPPWRFDIISPPPQIAVNPASLSETLEFGQTSTQSLTITNNGGLPLDFSFGFADTTTRGSQILPYDPGLAQSPDPNAVRASESTPFIGPMPAGDRAIFDLQFNYATTPNQGEYGIASDGSHFYTANWGYTGILGFNKYTLDGTFVETFLIPGVPGIRDLAYDGTYFYGAAASTTIYQMDFGTATLVGTITSPVPARGIAYDPDTDSFWVGNQWSADLRQVSRAGVQLAALTPAVASFAGLAYDNLSGPVPTLWGFTQTGASLATWAQIDIATGAVLQSYDMATSGINLGASSAGGAEIVTDLVPGTATLVGNVQNVSFFGLELCDIASWVKADPRSGTVPAGGSYIVDIDYDATETSPGVHTGIFTISSNAPTGPVEVPVTLTITGDWPAVFSMDPNSWGFGDAEQLNSVGKSFTITNTGGPFLTLNAGDFYITGDAEGNFAVNPVGLPVSLGYNESYNFTVIFTPQTTGAKTATLNIQDNITRVVHTAALSGTGIPEAIGQVVNLQATVQNHEDVALTWALVYGGAGTPGWLHYDDGVNFDGIGAAGAANFDVAVKFPSSTMWSYGGMELTHIKFFPRSANTNYILKIWTGSDASLAPTTLVYQQPVVPTIGVWNDITLTTPYVISGSESVWFGYNNDVYVIDAGTDDYYPAGCDAGPAVVGYGDIIYFSGSWVSMFTQYGLDYNWNLQAYVDDPIIRGSKAPLLSIPVIDNPINAEFLRDMPLRSASGNTSSRVLRGFNVYRDAVQINPALVLTNAYTDIAVPVGTYDYTVQAVYYSANSPMSDPLSVTVEPYVPPMGDKIQNPFIIPSLPFNATGTTVGFEHDYGPYGDPAGLVNLVNTPTSYFSGTTLSTSPDVVYQLTLTEPTLLAIDLLGSNFDSALALVTAPGTNPADVYLINDDYYGSPVPYVSYVNSGSNYVPAGVYYIVIGGYASSSGNYVLNVTTATPPLAPEVNVAVDDALDQVILSWVQAPGTTYDIYSDVDPYGGFTNLVAANVNAATYTIVGIPDGKMFYRAVGQYSIPMPSPSRDGAIVQVPAKPTK